MAFRNIRHKFQYRMHEDMRKGAFLYEYPLKQPTFLRLSRLAAIPRMPQWAKRHRQDATFAPATRSAEPIDKGPHTPPCQISLP